VFDTFQDVSAAFESYRCGQLLPAHASPVGCAIDGRTSLPPGGAVTNS
jgi:hypothetical protein